MKEDYWSRAPWGLQPSVKEMAEEVGIDFDCFIEGMAKNMSDVELAEELGVTEKTINHLRDHFERFGVHSIVGQD